MFGGGGLNFGPPASITWDIFYMIEPSARDWTHMTTFRQPGWIRMCIFGKKPWAIFVPPLLLLSPFMSLTPNKLFQTNRQLTDRD